MNALELKAPAGQDFVLRWWVPLSVSAGVALAVASVAFNPLTLPIQGVVVGAFQWLALRRYLERAHWWIFATGVGGFVGSIVSVPLVLWASDALRSVVEAATLTESVVVLVPTAVIFAIIGAIMGATQWQVLRARSSGPGWYWILASSLGLATSAAASLFLGAVAFEALLPMGIADLGYPTNVMLVGVFGGAMGGVGYGLITRYALSRLLRHGS